ncbi:MAG: hypothetical protein WAW75_10765, partial [Gallionella sp.]
LTVIDSRSGNEGSKNATAKGYEADGVTAETTIIFSNLGTVVNPTPLQQVDLDSAVLAPVDSHDLRVTIGLGGNVRMCNPNLAAGSSPQAC